MNLIFFLGMLAPAALSAATTDYSSPDQVQPYIESMKKKYDIKQRPAVSEERAATVVHEAPVVDPQAVTHDPEVLQPHIEKLRREDAEKYLEKPALGSPTDASRDTGRVQPYIEALRKDQELKPNFKGKVDQAAGFSFVASNQFNIKSNKVQANTFENVYAPDSKYSQSGDVFYERQIFRNHYTGAVGLVAHLNFITIKGKGIFTRSGVTSPDTEFRFYAMPVSLGGSYRFLQLRFVAPFIQLSAVGIPFIETRNDDHPSRRGISRGFNVTGGVAFSLDWIGRKDAWEQYDVHGILHTYLLMQMEYLRTISGPVAFNYNGTYLGLMFEF